MAKSFSEHERNLIRQNLINACKKCWHRYGYQKTGIRQLAEMAAISTGAFYQFYDSKELLFVDTAQEYEKELTTLFESAMQKSPDKHGIAAGLKAILAAMADMPWLTSMQEEWPIIARKLQPDFIEKDFRKDMTRIKEYVEIYGLQTRENAETVTQVIDILLTSVGQLKYIPGDTSAATGFIIDAVVDKLFKEEREPCEKNNH